ncbi:hypothetical protein, variant [Verruconis gallopava]|uniref:Biogenesis of lysosome-related organelles complex 1 subunit KXD1 n=1 Tax=Verruconis gallopava TaxID=253628 RepID=A0A0D2A8K8_9PEZI|nr:uncharacterized protein PV09_05723 [Verruconis gallopava]XP_016212947.1 hypothetical protein, variant [Verruconis gallopava]KIW03077.1 hypothetical protein PV09_05723 [Verruconis gallopava]KIW03078.1 hypothetical protein, variant [Verruconis gallopava]
MSSQYASQYYGYQPSQPINMPQKQSYQAVPQYPHQAYSRMPGSPPEVPESVSTGSGITSYDPSAASSSYAGSASEYESASNGASSVDLMDYMNERLSSVYNPMPLDRSVAQQAQTSGQLNAKQRKLMELQALAQSRMAAMQANFAQGIKDAKEVQRDLKWTQERVQALNQRAARKYPEQYAAAQERYPAPVDY